MPSLNITSTSPSISCEMVESAIVLHKQGHSVEYIAAQLDVDRRAISRQMRRNGVVTSLAIPSSVMEKAIDHYTQNIRCASSEGATMKEAAKKFGITRDVLQRALSSRGLNRGNRKYSVNENFFEDIDSEEKAYFLGFLSADGCMTTSGFQIILAERDREMLEILSSVIGQDKPLREGTTQWGHPFVRMDVHSIKIRDDLTRHGLFRNKSLTLKPWSGHEGVLGKHYWRGAFDGDGCICRFKDNREVSVTFAGSEEMVGAFGLMSARVCGSGAMPREQGSIFTYRVGGTKMPCLVLSELYGECSIALERKRLLAVKAIDELGVPPRTRRKKQNS